MHRIVVATLLGMLAALASFAQPVLQLKSRSPASGKLAAAAVQAPASRSLSAGRRHWVIQFFEMPTAADLETLAGQGAEILQYVPDHGLLVSLAGAMELDWDRVARVEALTSADKLSPEWTAPGGQIAELSTAEEAPLRLAVLELYPDVTDAEARQIASNEGVRVAAHADLDGGRLLVEGRDDQLAALTSWDEVAYLYPASLALSQGERVHACVGALTQFGAVGQYVARIGEGWDGPGRNPANLRYVFGRMTAKLPAETVQAEVRRALAEWSRVVDVNFTMAGSAAGNGTIHVMFAAGAHGDPFPFDGPGRVYAHTFYPAPPNPEPLAGDLHLDDAESWRIGNDVDLYSVVLHELGHALGLAHSDKAGSVMYPYYGRVGALTGEDIAAIRDLYATRATPQAMEPAIPTEPAAPAVPEPAPPAQPAPAPAPASPSGTPDKTPPKLVIVTPSATSVLVSASTITIKGTASDSVGVEQVTWQSNVYGTETAHGTRQWTATVPLAVGQNTIIIKAFDAAGNFSWRSLAVTRK